MKLFQVDAFTKERFKGNPAGVLLSNKPLDNDYMQSLASEMNLSETAFTWLDGNKRIIKYFTPTLEVDLCGHATLATAHILWEQGLEKTNEMIFIANKDVAIELKKESDKISFSFPKVNSKRTDILSQDYCNLFDKEVFLSDMGWLTIVVDSEKELLNVQVKNDQLIEKGIALIISTKGEQVDYALRVFAPHAGIPEDPVTGFAQTIASPIWADKLNKSNLCSQQLSKRGGNIWSETKDDQVTVSGHAITMFELNIC